MKSLEWIQSKLQSSIIGMSSFALSLFRPVSTVNSSHPHKYFSILLSFSLNKYWAQLTCLFLSNYFPLPLFSSGLCYKKLTYENYKLKALLLSGWVQLMRVIGRTLEGRRKGEAREFLSSILSVLGWIFGRDCVSPKVPAHFKVYPSWAEFLEVATSLGFLYCTALPCKLLMFRQI